MLDFANDKGQDCLSPLECRHDVNWYLGLFQIEGVEAFGEAAAACSEEIVGVIPLTLPLGLNPG
jgi:hypothetical protein